MTVWRLPDLTGLELQEADRCILHGVDAVSLELPDGRGYVDLPLAVLVEVTPSRLPPEPPVGSVVLFGGEAVQRFEDNELADDPSAHWASVGSTERYTWPRLNEINRELPVLLLWAQS